MSPLCFTLWIVAKLDKSTICLFDAIIELQCMDEKMFNDLLIKVKVCLIVINAYLISEMSFVYVVEAFIILNWRA